MAPLAAAIEGGCCQATAIEIGWNRDCLAIAPSVGGGVFVCPLPFCKALLGDDHVRE